MKIMGVIENEAGIDISLARPLSLWLHPDYVDTLSEALGGTSIRSKIRALCITRKLNYIYAEMDIVPDGEVFKVDAYVPENLKEPQVQACNDNMAKLAKGMLGNFFRIDRYSNHIRRRKLQQHHRCDQRRDYR
jgi:hypothetical protein